MRAIKKNNKRRLGSSRTRKVPAFDITPVLHVDKIELRILPMSSYLFDPNGFARIRSMIEEELDVHWRQPSQPKSLSTWTWSAWNNDFGWTCTGDSQASRNPSQHGPGPHGTTISQSPLSERRLTLKIDDHGSANHFHLRGISITI